MLCLLFSVGSNKLVLDCESIVEIIPSVKLTKIPTNLHYIAGVLNYSGIPVPVVDIARIIENRESRRAMHTRIVILKSAVYGSEFVALVCEKATTTLDIDANDFKNPVIKDVNFPFLEGIYTIDNDTYQFFNVDKLLTIFHEDIHKTILSV